MTLHKYESAGSDHHELLVVKHDPVRIVERPDATTDQSTSDGELTQQRGPSTDPGRLLWPGPADHSAEAPRSCLPTLPAVLEHEFAQNTMRTYRSQWGQFAEWARSRGLAALPADAEGVAAFLLERAEQDELKAATLRVAAAAITFAHRKSELPDPCTKEAVKRVLRSVTRQQCRAPTQAGALTAERFQQIQEWVACPRLGRGGRCESPAAARARSDLDIALIGLMRDALLRVSEAAALTWSDLSGADGGSGRLLIRRSKTDADGVGAVAFVSSATMCSLHRLQRPATDPAPLFGLRPNQISKRIKRAAQEAGLGNGFSGHSPRVGMAQDLARTGIALPSLMNAGRWRHPAMPAHYTRNEAAARGAVAQYYGQTAGRNE